MTKDKNLRHAIIVSAFKHFSTQPYHKVSTNLIVEDAGVSKGLLFHYFKDKKTLYITLYDLAWKTIFKDVFEHLDLKQKCLFIRFRDYILLKSKSLQNHKTLSLFIKQVHLHQDPEIFKERSMRYLNYQENAYRKIFDNIDTTLFRPDLDLQDTYKIFIWTLQRVTNEWEKQNAENPVEYALPVLEKELSHYIQFFEKAFYL